ncbi:right-handed parallel beta-helix repeat-containing protein [Streptomyces sp. NPDC020917]|uniref:right-handed parallel beta-helix repeat-containing protein n=1 Tax=Streptomyces sp. NPDC020917 TaxID=3365102 RepID=UPI00378D010E
MSRARSLALALAMAVALLPLGALHAAAAAGSAPSSCNYYVSPAGSDSAPGTVTAPWRTLEHARDYIRTNNLNQHMTSDLTVCLRGGRYTRTQTFSLTDADSGSDGHKVIWAAYPGEAPIVDGGKAVTGWTQVPGQPYWVADVPTTAGYASYFRQLYVGGVRAQLATGKGIAGTSFFRDTSVPNPGNPDNPGRVYDGIVFPASAIRDYSNVTDLRLVHQGAGFKADYFPVTRITSDGANARVYLQQPWFQSRLDAGSGLAFNDTFYVQNAFQELDSPGEWYLDQATHRLYYYPRAGERMATAHASVPVVETLVDVRGTSGTSKAHDIEVTGITFEHGNWMWPGSTFFGGSQAEAMYGDPDRHVYTTNVPGQIKLTNTDQISFIGNTVRYSANGGLQLLNGADHTTVTGNLFYNTTAAGIIAGRWEDLAVTADQRTEYAKIDDNVVYDTGDDFWQATGISLMNTYAVTVTHNLVFNTAYAGIHQRMADETGLYAGADGIGRTTFSYNEVYNAGTKKSFGMRDSGSIYSFGAWPGSSVDHNYVHGVTTGRAYMSDNQSYQTRWDYNVADGGLFFAASPVRSPLSVYASHNYTTTATGSNYTYFIFDVDGAPHVSSDTAWPAEAQGIISGAGLEPAYARLLRHVPVSNLADYATARDASGWINAQPAKLWDGVVETGEEGGTANTASIEYDFPADYRALTFRLSQDGNGTYQATAWKVQRWNSSLNQWADIMPYQTLAGPGQVVYRPANNLATTKIRLYVENANAGGLVGVQEFSVTGQYRSAKSS